MAMPDDVIEHRSLGMRCRWIDTTASSQGRTAAGEMFVPAGCPTPPPHIHPCQEEHLRVVAGAAVVTIAKEPTLLGPGQEARIPAGTAHTFAPAHNADLTIVASLSPALDWDEFCALAWQIPAGKDGRPAFLRMASLLHRFPGRLYMAGPPITLQKAMIAAGATVAHLTGKPKTAIQGYPGSAVRDTPGG